MEFYSSSTNSGRQRRCRRRGRSRGRARCTRQTHLHPRRSPCPSRGRPFLRMLLGCPSIRSIIHGRCVRRAGLGGSSSKWLGLLGGRAVRGGKPVKRAQEKNAEADDRSSRCMHSRSRHADAGARTRGRGFYIELPPLPYARLRLGIEIALSDDEQLYREGITAGNY